MKVIQKYALIWKICLIGGTLFLPMLIIWLLIGEINLLQTNWLVAEFGKKWGPLLNGTEGFGINTESLMVSWQPFVYCLGACGLNVIVFYGLYKFKLVNLNFFPILIGTWALLFMVIVSGLLYPNPQNMSGDIWKIVVRLIVVVISFPLVFFISNWTLMAIIAKRPLGVEVAKDILDQEIANAQYIKDNIDIVKPKTKKAAKKTSVDIIE